MSKDIQKAMLCSLVNSLSLWHYACVSVTVSACVCVYLCQCANDYILLNQGMLKGPIIPMPTPNFPPDKNETRPCVFEDVGKRTCLLPGHDFQEIYIFMQKERQTDLFFTVHEPFACYLNIENIF